MNRALPLPGAGSASKSYHRDCKINPAVSPVNSSRNKEGIWCTNLNPMLLWFMA